MADPRREPPRGGGPRGGTEQNRWEADSETAYQTVGTSPASLFDKPAEPPPFQRTSATSRAAAEAIAPKKATLLARLLEAYERWGPMTDDEAGRRTGIAQNSLRPRRVWGVEQGLIVAGGIGTSDSGRKATVWRLADRPHVQERAPRTTERAEVDRPAGSAPTGDLWTAALRDRPSWMSRRQHERLLSDAYEANNGDVTAALKQVAKSLERLR